MSELVAAEPLEGEENRNDKREKDGRGRARDLEAIGREGRVEGGGVGLMQRSVQEITNIKLAPGNGEDKQRADNQAVAQVGDDDEDEAVPPAGAETLRD